MRQAVLHDLFVSRARATPELPAVVADREVITYRDLDERSNVAASTLSGADVTADSIVGLIGTRTVGTIVGILGILKAGGAYLPLDPSHPPARVRELLERAGSNVVLSALDVAPELADSGLTVLDLPSGRQPPPNPGARSKPESLAYVLFTSGSTGAPKGVACTHAGVPNLLADFEAQAPLPAGARLSLWTNFTFDVSVFEIFGALLYGHTLYIVPEALRASSKGLVRWIVENRITGAYLPAFVLPELLDALRRDGSTTCALQRLLVGVEPIPEKLLMRLREEVPQLRIVNGYGPTETTICATLYRVPTQRDVGERMAPIGRPVRHCSIYILDGDLQPMPNGRSGEIYVGGIGVARGYVGRRGLTASRFLPDPFSGIAGARMYRTGDLAVRDQHGDIHFLGRSDRQVKVRGHRVEPGEIESTLAAHGDIVEAAVVPVSMHDGTHLVAHVVQSGTVDIAAIRAFLRTKLPEHMIPTLILAIPGLPRTANGKIDYASLAAPAGVELARPAAGPLDGLEGMVARIWAAALGVQSVDLDANFFDIGGTSLRLIEVVNALNEELGIELSPLAIAEYPSIRSLTRHLDRVLERALRA